MRDIVLEALSKGSSGAYQLALEHHTSIQAGDGALLNEEEKTKIYRYFDSGSLRRPLNASWYGIAMMRFAVAAYDVEAQKLIGGCRLLRALLVLQGVLRLKEMPAEAEGLDERTKLVIQVLGEYGVDEKTLTPAKLRINKTGSPQIDINPLQKEVREQFQNMLVPYAVAIGTIQGFQRFLKVSRVSTKALRGQIRKYKKIVNDEIGGSVAKFADLIEPEELPNHAEIVEANAIDIHNQCIFRWRGAYE